MPYQQVFGGTTIYPSDVSYLAITLSADKALEWPLESNDPQNPASRIIDVTTSGSGYSVVLPDATLTGAGQTILFNNLAASTSSFTIKDYAGNTIATVGIGEQWQVYLAATTTAAGTWRVFRYGASTATVQASALAGYGVAVTSGTLSQSLPVTTFNSGPRAALITDRASALVWTGTGAGMLNLPSAATAANNFFIAVRNNGGGDLTVDAAGSETIDGAATLTLRPGDSTQLITDGIGWYTLGLGQQAVFAFDYTSISVTGGTYTLAGSELNRIAYEFVGNLGSDLYVVVPSTIQQYWISNATTGPYAMYLQTSGGTPVSVTQGARGIYYCNGSNVVDADTSTVSLPISAANGGTGITSYSVGDLLYANSATTLTKLSDVATGNALLSGGITTAPTWGKIGLTTHVSGTLPVSNGGTGATTASAARTALGATTVGANVFTLTNPSAVTFLQVNADNTVSALDAATFRTAIGAGTGGGTVTSVSGAGTVNGLTLTGTVTSSGSLTLGGTLSGIANSALTNSSITINGSAISLGGSVSVGTVTSVNASGGTTGLTFSGGAITGSGTLTLGGTLGVANGGTGATGTPTNGQLLIGNGTGYTLAALTAGSNVTITNSAGGITIAATSTGLTNWAEAVSTAAPNATKPAVSFTATNAATNVDAVFSPKGNGAVLAQVPDNATAGGNKRGNNAVDWQTARASASQVASANNATIGGGGNNTAGATYATVAGGVSNTASASYTTIGGGNGNSANGLYSTVPGGSNNTANSEYSIATGNLATTRNSASSAFASAPLASPGSGMTQHRRLILARQTTDASATVLATNSSAAGASNQVDLPNNSAYYFKGAVIANVTGGGNTKGWTIEGVIKRGANAASTALVGTATVTSNYADSGASAWTVAVSADTTNGCLTVTVTGQASTTIRWVANIETTEVTY